MQCQYDGGCYKTLDDIAKIQRLNKTYKGFDHMKECLSLTTKKGK